MAIPYRVVERPLPLNREETKFYAQARVLRNVSHRELCESATFGRSVTAGEVAGVVEVMVRIMKERLQAGDSVEIEGLGNFRMSLSSLGADTEAEFHDGLIRRARLIFSPCRDLKNMVRTARYSKSNMMPTKRPAVVPDDTPSVGD